MAHRQLGDLQISRVLEMIMPFDSRAFFPEVTAEQWQPHLEWLAPDGFDVATGELLLPMQSYVVRTRHHTILVDSCVGNHKERPTRPAWHLKSDQAYLQALAAQGFKVEDIDFVMCTHLHSDHVGWNTRLQDGRWVPTFPNARYVFSEKETAAWRDVGHEKFARTPFEDSVLPIIEAGRADLVGNDFALDDEVWLEPTPGHTPDHVAVNLRSGGGHAVMCGDLMHTPVQCLHPEWVPWPDWDPGQASDTRRAFMERYCETDTLICTAHFPLPSAGRIVRAGDAFRFQPDAEDW
jgi:glyoxylase-like metal-dependent hydrolase (beta-lactamase superfamily II)